MHRTRRNLALALASVALTASCVTGLGSGAAPEQPSTSMPSGWDSTVTNLGTASAFADPWVLGDFFGVQVAWGTSDGARWIPVSANNGTRTGFSPPVEAVAALSSDINGFAGLWAPALTLDGNQSHIYVSAATNSNGGKRCIWAGIPVWGKSAVDSNTWVTASKVKCDPHGVIDASPFFDPVSGKHYLYYKYDDNSVGQPSRIAVAELSADRSSLVPGTEQIITRSNDPSDWDGRVVEGPSVAYLPTAPLPYVMLFSGNDYSTPSYATGVAYCLTPTSGCQYFWASRAGNPFLTTSNTWEPGPGGAEWIVGGMPGTPLAFAYHSGVPADRRILRIRAARVPCISSSTPASYCIGGLSTRSSSGNDLDAGVSIGDVDLNYIRSLSRPRWMG